MTKNTKRRGIDFIPQSYLYLRMMKAQSPSRPIISMNKPVILVGMMGVGKTHIGKLVADYLDLAFIDTDIKIEESTGKKIKDIFAEDGEATFRDIEAKIIAQLLAQQCNSIIATGGGSITNPDTRGLIKDKALSIWLKASPDCIFSRVKSNRKRPLLLQENPLKVITDLLHEREPYYAAADIHVSTEKESPEIIAHHITKLLSLQANGDKT